MIEQNNSEEQGFRFKRLTQLIWAVEIAFAGFFVLELINGEYLLSAAIAALGITLLGIHGLVHKGRVDRAAVFLFGALAFSISTLMWTFGGLQDETLLGFPVVLLFAALLGNTRLLIFILVYIIATVAGIAITNELGLRVNEPPDGGILSGLIIIILLLVVTYSIWLLAEDIKRMFVRLNQENERARESQEKIEQLLHHDALTNLPNRILAKEHFDIALSHASRDATLVCLMFLDLDDFKSINDSMGHQSGDNFLLETATRLKSAIRESDTVCRQGGDEFLVILGGIPSEESIAGIANKILETVKQPISINGSTVISTVSIGITVARSNNFDNACREADMAMYHAKDQGRDRYCFFDHEMNLRALKSRQLLSDIRTAIFQNQFELYFQPKIDLKSQAIVGAEALIRWNHPSKGMILPDDFIPEAERSGIIVDISKWVVKEACRQCKVWESIVYSPVSVAVNISPLEFKRGKLLDHISLALAETALNAGTLELEITESLLMDDSLDVSETFRKLRRLGVEIAIDDFGTGYSNLGYLKKFDVGVLKIDRSFIGKILSHPEEKAIVHAIIQIANSLNLKTIAEGVESQDTANVLLEMGCDMAQGYLWSRPLESKEFCEFLKLHNSPA